MTPARIAVLCSGLALLLFGQPSAGADGDPLAALQSRLSNHLAQPRFASATWGVKIASLDSGRTLFEHNAGKLLKPASNAKLFTGALALDRLGPDFHIKTSLHAATSPDDGGILRSDLLVYGRGDPSFAARFRGGSYTNLLGPLVEALSAAGVRQIDGNLVGDESFFQGPPLGSTWAWDDLQFFYGAEASALTVQDNVVDLTFRPGPLVGAPCRVFTLPVTKYLSFSNRTETIADSTNAHIRLYRPIGENTVYVSGTIGEKAGAQVDAVAVHDPALWFLTLFRDALTRRGIRVSGGLRTLNWLDRQIDPLDLGPLVEIASVESAPLSQILTRMMKPSQNLYAHLLLLQVGARALATNAATRASEPTTTEEAGLAELRKFLARAGIDRDEVLLEEGSGLSRGALVTPNSIVALLRFMERHRHAAIFRDGLPEAGVDGTLRNRMKGTAAAGNARAKTGTLLHVNTLSGHVKTQAGEHLVFSLILNNYPSETRGRAALDTIVVMLANLETKLEQ